jgi:SAM-dependent methyltransferase
MKALHYGRYSVARVSRGEPRLTYKGFNELRFWAKEIRAIVDWYLGRVSQYWSIPAPTAELKVSQFDLTRNAILTWANASLDYYPRHLLLPTDSFTGGVILDIGCGPIPHAQAFTGCQVCNLDPLVSEYRKLGFPLELHSPRLTFVSSRAEQMPFETASFDAVISVNAIDHVDDFEATAWEIARVLRPGGVLRFEAHYHQPTSLEPWSLSDEIILRHFAPLGVNKVHERPYREVDSESETQQGEMLTIWASRA